MTYISNAIGTLQIEVDNRKALDKLKECFNLVNSWRYNISCKGLDDKKIVVFSKAEIQLYGYLKYEVTCEFNGKGQESFPVTIEIFQDWLNKEIITNQLLLNSEFRITFEYVDQDPKQNFIIESRRIIFHKPKDNTTTIICGYIFKHDYTLVNKAKYTGDFLNNIIIDEFENKSDFEIFSILQKERKEIEKYTGKLLEIYLYENGFDNYAEICNENSLAFIRPFEQNFG